MEIEVTGSVAADFRLLRAYAEYRVFSSLAIVAAAFTHVRVRVISDAAGGTLTCAIRARLGHGAVIRVRSRCPQPTKAIDRAADRLARVAIQRLGRMRSH